MRLLKHASVANARIFGTKIGNYGHYKSGNKEMQRKLAGPMMADYYPATMASKQLYGFVDPAVVTRRNRADRKAKRIALKASAGSPSSTKK